MFKIPSFNTNPLLYFIWHLLILIGMVITFYIIGGALGIGITKAFFRIDLYTSFYEIISNPSANAYGILALKMNQALISVAIFIIPAYLFAKSLNQNPVRFLQINKRSFSFYYLIIPLLIILAIPISSWLLEVNKSISFPENFKNIEIYLRGDESFAKLQTEAFVYANGVSMLLFNIIIVAVIPAITEEVFFRGCLQNFVRQCFYNIHISILFSAIIFSAIHGDFLGFLPRFMFGVVLGYAFAYSGNLWVSILGHFLNNSITLIAYYMANHYPNIEFLKDDYSFPYYVVLVASIGVVAIIFFMGKFRQKLLK